MNITTIHEKVYAFLINRHRTQSDLLFSLRTSNRKERLTKGYWFWGNDHTVAVSFWTGMDKDVEMPRISFMINRAGECYLSIYADSINSNFTIDLVTELNPNPNMGGYIIKKYDSFLPKDYIKCLEKFIENDKKLIDEAIKRYRVASAIILDNKSEVNFLSYTDFNNDREIIAEYRQQREEGFKATGYLRSIAIKNFGAIKSLSIDDIPGDCRWLFITGENGAGKTSFLRALATGLCNNNDGDAPIAKDYKDFKISLTLDDVDGLTTTEISANDDYRDKSLLPRGFAAYGPVRLITIGSLDKNLFNANAKEILNKKAYGLFHPVNILEDISVPIELLSKPKYHDLFLQDLLESIAFNLTQLLPNIERVEIVEYDSRSYDIEYYQGDKESLLGERKTSFHNLPSGTKNFAALILDLILKFRDQFVDLRDITNINGIVLIDEIDLHLHPKMQKEIVMQLNATFPKIQFIVTTHSPIPLLGAPDDAIFIKLLHDNDTGTVAQTLNIEIKNLLPNTLLTSPIFDFDDMLNNNYKNEDRLVTEDDYSEAVFYRILEKKIREKNLDQ